ncbi:unnamed protein product [Arabidopsis arenosa]|uniref:Uncharacterized protein n=1 Tax=Arabidopsis arenosa TaxID=38785 RepID=A0A8S2ASV1_ARAAE|nr:unnamed protein product [Arabidopsis arenosa]
MLNSCGLEDSRITFVIPGPDNRPWNPPRGYICLYEAYFRQCRLWFSIPSLLIGYIHRHKLAISQLTPAAICNFVVALVFGAEEGYRVNVDFFEELTTLKANKSSGTWVVNNRPPFLTAGSKVSNFKSWESCYFYVRIDLHSSERPLSGRRRMWNDDPVPHTHSRHFPAEYEEVKSAIFRAQDRTWRDVTRDRVARIMGKLVLRARTLLFGTLPVTPIPELPQVADGSIGGDSILAASEAADVAQDRADTGIVGTGDQIANTRAITPVVMRVDYDLTAPEVTKDGPSTEKAVAAEKRTKSQEDKGKGVAIGGKRSASDAGLSKEGPPQKTFSLTRDDPDRHDRFSFQYVGGQHLIEDKETACQLWSSMLLPGAKALPDPDELIFSEDYKTRQVATHQADLEKAAVTHQAEVALLKCEIANLKGDLVAVMNHEEKELARLRDDRLTKVTRTTEKAQARLHKVKSYMKEQADVVQPKVDAWNQSKGVHETVAILIDRGAVIAETELKNLAKETQAAEEEVDALDVLELADADLNMSPDQLGFERASPSAQISPVPDQHGSNSELVSQSDVRDVAVEEKDAEA